MCALESKQVIYTDTSSPARCIPFGEDFLEEHLPVGTRVIFPNPPMEPLAHPSAAIRYALSHPEGGVAPLYAQLKPGMKVTIAVDDISLPLPPMVLPDLRQMMLEIVLQMLGDHGVEDIHIIVATAFHRRMTEAEIRRMVGDKIYREYAPGRLYNHDGEDRANMVTIGETRHGEKAYLNRRAVDSDLLIYVNINLVPMDGGHKSVGTGLTGYAGLRAHHTPETIRQSNSYMDPEHSALSKSVERVGKIIEDNLNVFHIETAVNTRMYNSALNFLGVPEENWTAVDRAKFQSMKWTLGKLPRASKRAIFSKAYAPFGLIAVAAGEANAVHAKILEASWKQYVVEVDGQADILITGIPYISPYNVNSIMNPLLVQVMGLGYFFNMYKGGIPLLRKGGTMILCHPCYDEFHPEHHPSYIEFFNRLLPETTDALVLQEKYEQEFAENPAYIQMYRYGHAYHGVHPFYMWYWGENGRQHAGRVIAVGAESPHVPERMGWEWAPDLTTAIEMSKDTAPQSPQITLTHHPPILITEDVRVKQQKVSSEAAKGGAHD